VEVKRLKLNNFRNFSSYEIEPGGGVNVIYGDNAQGKTNIIEAIWLFTGGKSFRTSRDSELIKQGESWARNEMDFYALKRDKKVSLYIGEKKSVTLNGVKSAGSSELVGQFCCVAFTPMHMEIIKGGPAERRKFLDTSICQVSPGYLKALKEYTRVLTQRNALLKDISYESALLDHLDVWDLKLAEYAVKICIERERFIRRISEESEKIYEGISGGRERLALNYRAGIEFHDGFEFALDEIRKNRTLDIKYGSASLGPHRDELEITLSGISARSYGSQGQQRSCALALKLAESVLLEEAVGCPPVILLDDVMSELDKGRREYILKKLGDNQVFVTCCDSPEDYADVSAKDELRSFKLQNTVVGQA